MILNIEIEDALARKLDRMVSTRHTNKREYIRQLIRGAILTEDVQMGARMEEGELRIVKHFLNVDLFEDLQFLSPNEAQQIKRQLSAAILVYGDREGKLPDEVHMFKMKRSSTTASHHTGEWEFSAVSLNILDYCLCHLLPKRLRDKLCEWSVATTGTAGNVGTVLLKYLSKLYKAPKTDRVSEDISEEFRCMESEGTAEEAFNRSTK